MVAKTGAPSPTLPRLLLLSGKFLGEEMAAETFKLQLIAELIKATEIDLKELASAIASYEMSIRQ